MIPTISEKAVELEQLCRRYGVLRLDLFGSAATDRYLPEGSDLDFVVEFEALSAAAYADAYFGLLEALERLFGRPVDLVSGTAIKNPYFRQSLEETRTLVYEA